MSRLILSSPLSAVMLGLAVVCGGCQTYSLGFRPTDTTSQFLLTGVSGTLTRGDDHQSLGETNEHGRLYAPALKPGDILTFTAPGYEPTIVRIELGQYRLTPAGKSAPPIPLVDSDTLPIPMHPAGPQ